MTMAGSAGGPLGALLMIAPLAAIPIFAVVGIPQFASVVASPADDEEIADLGSSDSPTSPAISSAPSRSRTAADDIFSPVSEAAARSDSSKSRAARDGETVQRKNRSRGETLTLPPADALDQWEIRQTAVDEAPRGKATRTSPAAAPPRAKNNDPSESLELSDDDPAGGLVSAENFSPDLLKPELSQQAKPEKRNSRGDSSGAQGNVRTSSNVAQGEARGRRATTAADSPLAPPTAEINLAEQSGWRDATRRLKELGIRKYRLESQIEEQTFVFICSFAAVENPRVVRRFEAEADNPLEAVQKVIDEIDEWQRHGGRVISDLPRAQADE
jgi:hypothetical protein